MESKRVNGLPDTDRYEEFIETAVRLKAVWLLHASDGLYAMFEDGHEKQYIPVWPEMDIAASFAEGEWEGYEPEQMELQEFMDWLPELKEDEIYIGVFPSEEMQAIPVDPVVLRKQLKDAMDTGI